MHCLSLSNNAVLDWLVSVSCLVCLQKSHCSPLVIGMSGSNPCCLSSRQSSTGSPLLNYCTDASILVSYHKERRLLLPW